MVVRRLARGTVAWGRLEAVAREVADRCGRDAVRIRFVDADNWLSTAMVVADTWFVKVVSRRNSLVHALFTAGRNVGALSAGTERLFEHFGTPLQMAEHELAVTRRMRELGVPAPEPVDAFGVGDLGVAVFEYLDGGVPLDETGAERARRVAPELFDGLRRLHGAGLAHGDLRAENVLVVDETPHVVDATAVDRGARRDAMAYDVASALGALAPIVGADDAVAAARGAYRPEDVAAAVDVLGFVDARPEHDFDADAVRDAVERVATGARTE